MPKNKSISVLNRKYKNRGITFFWIGKNIFV
jgi:hypothetical protein